jgi:mannose-6-phosphate isomerase-like protein (cupin superfamily)
MASATASADSTRPSAPATHGAALTFETVADIGERVRPGEDTLLRVIHGIVHLTIDGAERLLGPGDEAIIAAGTPYTLASAGGEARFVTGFRPAAR